MTMEVEFNSTISEETERTGMKIDTEKDKIISHLAQNTEICFKSQQKWEADLRTEEKSEIALNLLETNKLNFLIRFGKYLKRNHLTYFEQYTENSEPDNEEIDLVLKDLYRSVSEDTHNVDIKNRRYAALLQMVADDSYFSEIEMMKRKPLLYEQLVGQYLTEEEKKERDKYDMNDEQITFVKILMEGIDRKNAELVRENEEEQEDCQMEEEDTSDEDESEPSSPVPSTSRWGEFEDSKKNRPKPKKKLPKITAQERLLLKEEFITTMYESFLDGKDEDFNYDTVDNNSSFDNITEMEHDDEDKYFATESPETIDTKDHESSEDELDIYMNALNQHPSVTKLSNDLQKL